MAPRLIARAKLQPPVLRKEVLQRPRLTTRLSRALTGRLTLVEADAGFGKTTLLAAHLPSADWPSVWLRLDPGDGDSAAFAAHLLEGLRPHLSRGAIQQARRSLGLVSQWSAATELLSAALNRLRRDLLLILDDYHLLGAPEVGEAMTRLIEDLPPRAHLVLLTRVRPDLPLARWLVQDLATEFTADDLRFTDPELRELVVNRYRLPLSAPTLHILGAKTEGWAAGIVLALNAVEERGPAEAARAIGALSGSTRQIYEYLAQEAFARQPAEVQRFLLATAALARFSAETADALLDIRGAGEIVAFLEQRHLFVVPLDPDRHWYRYHHLFQEFLRRLGIDRDPEGMRGVHARAARLWEPRGEEQEALHHYVEAGEVDEAARLLGKVGLDLIARGQSDTARRWLDAIAPHAWGAVPRLYLIQGVCDITRGDAGAAAEALEEARRRLRDAGDMEGEARALRWLAHGLLSWERGVERLQELVDGIRVRLHTFPPGARATCLEIAGRTAQMRGAFEEAERNYREAVAAAQAGGDEAAEGDALRYLGLLLLTLGRFAEARTILQALVARYHRRGWAHEEAHVQLDLTQLWGAVGGLVDSEGHLAAAEGLAATVPCQILHMDLQMSRAEARMRRGMDDVALPLLRRALEPGAALSRYPPERFRAQLLLAPLVRDQDPEEARRLVDEAETVASRVEPFLEARVLLARGLVMRSSEPCEQAAAIADRLKLPHWRAVALLRALEVAEPGASERLRDQAAVALGALNDETWPFVAAQVPRETLEAYRHDPEVGPRIHLALSAWRSADAAERLEIRCLGAFEIRRDGAVLPPAAWRRSSARRLFQLLLVQDRPLHREEVMEALWPDLAPRQAANRLRVALSHLRRVLEPARPAGQPSSFIFAAGATVALTRDRLVTDLARFRQALARAATSRGEERRGALAEAVETYQGDLFADSPYEEWAERPRARLAQQYLGAVTALAETDEEAGRWEAAMARWTALLERDPGAEHAHRGRIRACLALGRTGEALRALEDCRRALADLGATPSPETIRLRDRISPATP